MENRFFPRGLNVGDPVSKKGFVEGIIAMAQALDRISVQGGRVEWNNNVPKIIVDKTSA